MRKVYIPVIFVFVVIQLVGCRPALSEPTEQDTIAIYKTVVNQVYQSDDTFSGTLEKPVLYIVRSTNDAAGDPSLQQSDTVVLSETVQQGITDALSNLPTTITWIDSFDQVIPDRTTGVVNNNGVIITLGNIKYENSNKAFISASIYVANLAAGGKTYIIERKDGTWVITGTTGFEWIS